VLSCRDIRHERESIFVGDTVLVAVAATHNKKVRIGIEAPPDIAIDREESGAVCVLPLASCHWASLYPLRTMIFAPVGSGYVKVSR
jgi:hypothetical protein